MATRERGEGVWLLPAARWKDYTLPPQLLTRSPGHMLDWIRACKGGDPSCSDFSITAPYAEWLALAAIAFRVPGKLTGTARTLRFTNSAEANKYVEAGLPQGLGIEAVSVVSARSVKGRRAAHAAIAQAVATASRLRLRDRHAPRQDVSLAARTFAKATLPAEIEVYAAADGWCRPIRALGNMSVRPGSAMLTGGRARAKPRKCRDVRARPRDGRSSIRSPRRRPGWRNCCGRGPTGPWAEGRARQGAGYTPS